jgi:hypothetical protein
MDLLGKLDLEMPADGIDCLAVTILSEAAIVGTTYLGDFEIDIEW